MTDKKQILEALRKIKHPDQGKDIVSLGLVDDIEIKNNQLTFSLKFKKSNDPFINGIKKACGKVINDEFSGTIQIKNINIRIPERKSVHEKTYKDDALQGIKNIVSVASGKGGVGKSTVAVNLAVALAKQEFKVGIIDADIFGPSLPKMFQMEGQRPRVKKVNEKDVIVPLEQYGVKILSIGFFVNPDDALVWRGPMATSALQQLIHQSEWGELDYLIIDLPPGTSDIHLTMVQELAVTGALIVSTPQPVAIADALKGIRMFKNDSINIPVLGLIENMSWFTPKELPDNKYYIFGKDGCKKLAEQENVPLLGQVPIVQSIREGGDSGKPVALDNKSITGKAFEEIAKNVTKAVDERNKNMEPTQRVEIKHK